MDTNQQPTEQPQTESTAKSIGLFIWDLIKVFVISIVIILPIRYYVAQPFIVQGGSMEPNFHDGEYLIIDELTYKSSAPVRGDIIVFKFPKNTSEYFIKRIIGLPGETVQVKDAKVTVFNKQHPGGLVLQENYLPNQNVTFGSESKITLGTDEFFVLGDHRLASSDSRYWGPVPRNDIIGKVFIRAYPIQSFTKFGHVQYNS